MSMYFLRAPYVGSVLLILLFLGQLHVDSEYRKSWAWTKVLKIFVTFPMSALPPRQRLLLPEQKSHLSAGWRGLKEDGRGCWSNENEATKRDEREEQSTKIAAWDCFFWCWWVFKMRWGARRKGGTRENLAPNKKKAELFNYERSKQEKWQTREKRKCQTTRKEH